MAEEGMRKKVDYLCIGVAKAGTMSIINYLNFHPDIFCIDGEVHFFDSNSTNIENMKSYLRLIKE